MATARGTTPDDAWVRAHKETVNTPPYEQAAWLLDVIGPRYTAAGVGVADARTVRRWRDERTGPRDHQEIERLGLLFQITQAIHLAYGSPDVAAAFLRSANPQLDDESPLVVLAQSKVEVAQPRLLAATKAFLDG